MDSHGLAQRARRAQRQSSLHASDFVSRTEGAEGMEADASTHGGTQYFVCGSAPTNGKLKIENDACPQYLRQNPTPGVIPCRVREPVAWNLRACHTMDSRWLAQRTQRAWRARRQSSLSTALHASDFILPTSYLAQRTQRAPRQLYFTLPTSLHASDFTLPTS